MAAWTKHGIVALALGTAACTTPQLATPESGIAVPRDGVLVQDGIAGRLPLRVEGEGNRRTLSVRTPRASLLRVGSTTEPLLDAALAGLPLGRLPPALMDGGRRWWRPGRTRGRTR